MHVDYDGTCWLAEFDAAEGRSRAELLDKADVGFVMWCNGDRVAILANTPLPDARVLTGTLVDGVGSELIRSGAFLCGPWVSAPPEPWASEFGFFDLEQDLEELP